MEVDELTFGARFRDLVHGRLPHGSASFHVVLEAEDETLNLSAIVQNIAEAVPSQGKPTEYSVVSHFNLRSPSSICLKWTPAHGIVATYGGSGPLPFRGLLPDTKLFSDQTDRDFWSFAEEWRDRVQAFEGLVEHLGPHRCSIARVYEAGTPRPLRYDGGGAPGRLAADGALLDKAAAWYQEHLDGWQLSLSQSGSAFECTLSRGDTTVNLADAGQGMQQALPVVIQQLSHQTEDAAPFLDLVEQPELHLHTAAQAPLGDLFLNTAKTGRGQVIVETHSENLLMRIRRRIAEGADPNLVAVYWIEDHPEGHSSVRRININAYGELDWWREGIFSEGYEEVRAIRRAARMRLEATERGN